MPKFEKSGRIQMVIISAICLFVFIILFILIRNTVVSHRQKAEAIEKGVEYLQSLEERTPQEVKTYLQNAEENKRLKEIKEELEELSVQMENGNTDGVWDMFDNIFILGDSRSEYFTYGGFLTTNSVYAKKGTNLSNATGGVDAVVKSGKTNLVFTYGLNDCNGIWSSAEEFKTQYKKVIMKYLEAVSNASVYVCSIMPVTDEALITSPKLKNINEYNSMIKEICEEEGYTYINCDSLPGEHEDSYDVDGMHFTASFYPYFAYAIVKGVYENVT